MFHSHIQVAFAAALIILGVSNPLLAGWTSSGGETLKDKMNPWFLGNTETVKYCLLVDEQNFGQSTSQIRRRVKKTLQIWKHQLSNLKITDIAEGLTNHQHLLKLGTQNFVETACSLKGDKVVTDNVDLIFQFGVLSGEQLARLGDPTRYIGVTVRTDYDPVNLRGKGFIYFSPQMGPLKLNKVGLTQNPWTAKGGRNLLEALLHETGHIFGLQHSDHLPFMKEHYLESILRYAPDYWETNPYEKEEGDIFLMFNFFKFDMPEAFDDEMQCIGSFSPTPRERAGGPSVLSVSSAMDSSGFHRIQPVDDIYFGYHHGDGPRTYCLGIKKSKGQFRFEVVEKVEKGKKHVVGKAENLTRFDSQDDDKDLISIWLPKEQIVFENVDPIFSDYRVEFASMQLATLFKGTYQILATGEKRPFFINARTFWRHRYGGELNGIYYQDLFEGF